MDVVIKTIVDPAPKGPDGLAILCPHCLGSGKVRAMQMYAVRGGGSVRGPDTFVVCPTCFGCGYKRG